MQSRHGSRHDDSCILSQSRGKENRKIIYCSVEVGVAFQGELIGVSPLRTGRYKNNQCV